MVSFSFAESTSFRGGASVGYLALGRWLFAFGKTWQRCQCTLRTNLTAPCNNLKRNDFAGHVAFKSGQNGESGGQNARLTQVAK